MALDEEGLKKPVLLQQLFFSENAQKIAKQEKMELIDGKKLYYLIAKIRPELLAEAYFERLGYIKCPECRSGILKLKKNNKVQNSFPFIGCTNFPKCKHSMKIADYNLKYGKQNLDKA